MGCASRHPGLPPRHLRQRNPSRLRRTNGWRPGGWYWLVARWGSCSARGRDPTGGRCPTSWSRSTSRAPGLGDKAYSSRAIRTLLRKPGIRSVIPEPRDQQTNRRRRGRIGGRPVTYDKDLYKGRNVVERSFCLLKQWRGLATRYD